MGSDLRAAEQTYQLLSQVAGRAGRGEKSGEVWIQTLYPENAVLQALVDNDRGRFLELENRPGKCSNCRRSADWRRWSFPAKIRR